MSDPTEDVFRLADDLGPAKVIHVYEPALALKAVLVVDNVACGPSIGGLRMAPDVSTEECARLARAMTLKNAAAGLAHGGGKSVLWGDPRTPRERKERLIRAFAHALRNEEDYIFGPDMGTDESCMAWVKDEIGRAVGLPAVLGGIPLDEMGATGWGIRHAAEVAAPYCGFDLSGARVVIQGFGAVGKHSARFLAERGAILVAASDSQGAIHRSEGHLGCGSDRIEGLRQDSLRVSRWPQSSIATRCSTSNARSGFPPPVRMSCARTTCIV